MTNESLFLTKEKRRVLKTIATSQMPRSTICVGPMYLGIAQLALCFMLIA